MKRKNTQTNIASVFQLIYHTNAKNSVHREHTLQMIRGQGQGPNFFVFFSALEVKGSAQ